MQNKIITRKPVGGLRIFCKALDEVKKSTEHSLEPAYLQKLNQTLDSKRITVCNEGISTGITKEKTLAKVSHLKNSSVNSEEEIGDLKATSKSIQPSQLNGLSSNQNTFTSRILKDKNNYVSSMQNLPVKQSTYEYEKENIPLFISNSIDMVNNGSLMERPENYIRSPTMKPQMSSRCCVKSHHKEKTEEVGKSNLLSCNASVLRSLDPGIGIYQVSHLKNSSVNSEEEIGDLKATSKSILPSQLNGLSSNQNTFTSRILKDKNNYVSSMQNLPVKQSTYEYEKENIPLFISNSVDMVNNGSLMERPENYIRSPTMKPQMSSRCCVKSHHKEKTEEVGKSNLLSCNASVLRSLDPGIGIYQVSHLKNSSVNSEEEIGDLKTTSKSIQPSQLNGLSSNQNTFTSRILKDKNNYVSSMQNLPLKQSTYEYEKENIPLFISNSIDMVNNGSLMERPENHIRSPIMKPTMPSRCCMKSYQEKTEKVGKLNSLSYDASVLMTLDPGVGVIDTHCHLDFLFKKTNYKNSYFQFRSNNKSTYPTCYEGCVAVFCDPQNFNKHQFFWERVLQEEGVWAAYGCHPHMAKDFNAMTEKALRRALENPKVVALGEIGLDYSNKNTCRKEIQEDVFYRQIMIALKKKLPLIIHCRDAHEDCLKMMKNVVPKDYHIHLHCFTEGWEKASVWLQEFPNLYIGITNIVTFPTATDVHDTVRKIPLERLLLETDAPYFVPRKMPDLRQFSHPGMVIHVAAQIASLKGAVSLSQILHAVRSNTRKMYGI